MLIRSFRPDDLPTLKRIMVEAFRGVSIDEATERLFGPINGHDWQWRKARHLDEDLLHDPHGIFVAEIEGQIVGFISRWQDHDAGIGHIPNLAFVPEWRGKGLGRRLIDYALGDFRRSGLTHAKIETLEQNAIGTHLYTSPGFREVARQIHFVCKLAESEANDQP